MSNIIVPSTLVKMHNDDNYFIVRGEDVEGFTSFKAKTASDIEEVRETVAAGITVKQGVAGVKIPTATLRVESPLKAEKIGEDTVLTDVSTEVIEVPFSLREMIANRGLPNEQGWTQEGDATLEAFDDMGLVTKVVRIYKSTAVDCTVGLRKNLTSDEMHDVYNKGALLSIKFNLQSPDNLNLTGTSSFDFYLECAPSDNLISPNARVRIGYTVKYTKDYSGVDIYTLDGTKVGALQTYKDYLTEFILVIPPKFRFSTLSSESGVLPIKISHISQEATSPAMSGVQLIPKATGQFTTKLGIEEISLIVYETSPTINLPATTFYNNTDTTIVLPKGKRDYILEIPREVSTGLHLVKQGHTIRFIFLNIGGTLTIKGGSTFTVNNESEVVLHINRMSTLTLVNSVGGSLSYKAENLLSYLRMGIRPEVRVSPVQINDPYNPKTVYRVEIPAGTGDLQFITNGSNIVDEIVLGSSNIRFSTKLTGSRELFTNGGFSKVKPYFYIEPIRHLAASSVPPDTKILGGYLDYTIRHKDKDYPPETILLD